MLTCSRCRTIMAPAPGTKCPACGFVSVPRPAALAAAPHHVPAPGVAPRASTTATRSPGPAPARRMPTAIEKVALGATRVLWAGVALAGTFFFDWVHRDADTVFSVLFFALALGGVLLIGSGLGFSKNARIVCAVLMIVPVVNAIVAIGLLAHASQHLAKAGYVIKFPAVRRASP